MHNAIQRAQPGRMNDVLIAIVSSGSCWALQVWRCAGLVLASRFELTETLHDTATGIER
jgi:hypothetical protein